MLRFIYTLLCCVVFSASLFSQATVGLIQENTAEDGYELFAPIKADTTYLIDKCGRLIHQWASPNYPGMSVYLLPNGNLLRSANVPNAIFRGNGAQGGAIEEYNWNNDLVWSYTISSDTQTQNHDIYPLTNGNILVVIWEAIDSNIAIAAGRNPAKLLHLLYSAKIEELQPVGSNQANIIWQWRLWDHLIQDFDSTKANYGIVANHPELVNLNWTDSAGASKDWIHPNAVTYNPVLDQVILSAHNLSEIWILDHSTTTAQAATHSGGNHSKGGDLLYRWGNPQVYNRGTAADEVFYTQHNPTWIPAGYPYAGSISIFNNGIGRPGGNASSADIFTPPVDSNGNYPIDSGMPYGPLAEAWSYQASPPNSFFSSVMGSVQMLTDGNIVVCEATAGNFFEIDSNKNVLWRYINPVNADTILSQGGTPGNNQVFRCTQYDPSFAGFVGDSLTPMSHIEKNPILTACDSVDTSNTTGIKSIVAAFDMMVYPNPASNHITIILNTDNGQGNRFSYKLYNATGALLQTLDALQGDVAYTIDLSSYAAGIYLLRVNNGSNEMLKKIVKTN